MENIREEVVDIRSCIAYLMVKWKIMLLALILGAVAGGAFGVYKQKTASAPTQVSYEESRSTPSTGITGSSWTTGAST